MLLFSLAELISEFQRRQSSVGKAGFQTLSRVVSTGKGPGASACRRHFRVDFYGIFSHSGNPEGDEGSRQGVRTFCVLTLRFL